MFSKIFERICMGVGAFFVAQFPQFYSQYIHQLSGHLAELRYQYQWLNQLAQQSQKTLPELILKFQKNSDLDIVRQGDFLQTILDRYLSYTEAYQQLEKASLIERPFVFMKHLHQSLVSDTLNHFHFGFNFNMESVSYALIGLILGYYVFQLLQFPFRKKSTLKEIRS